MTSPAERFDVRYVRAAEGTLREFNDAGVLDSADIHVARRLTELAGEFDPDVALALALAIRGPRLGHVFIDLASISETIGVDDSEREADLAALTWPAANTWVRKLADSVLVADEERGLDSNRPLRLSGDHLYLDRYWRQEVELAEDLRSLLNLEIETVDDGILEDGLRRLFPGETDTLQALAAATAVLNRFSVVAGGPGTGKTTTVARIAALVCEQAEAAGARPPLVALSAPTGKAAARLEESVRDEGVRIDTAESVSGLLSDLSASTVHRLLGWRPGSRSRFRHGRSNRLPHDLIIVDEASMVSLSMMASIVEAVRPEARLVLIGDPGQLTSIEAGAVLGDIVGPTVGGLRMSAAARGRLEAITGHEVEASELGGAPVGNSIVVLRRVHRFGESIGALADAIRIGDADAVVDLLADPPEEISWIGVDAGSGSERPELALVRRSVVDTARALMDAAAGGESANAIEALGGFRLLCAHRRGDHGVANWTARIERWLADEIETFADEGRWYLGRPLLITANDYSLRLYNGDIGVVVRRGESVAAAFERGGEVLEVAPSRLEFVQTAYAMTIHKSQGSQFRTAAVLLPPPDSRILTRELLYTAVTRAQSRLVLVGAEDAIRAAVERPVSRASGLRERLWGSEAQGARSLP